MFLNEMQEEVRETTRSFVDNVILLIFTEN